MQEAITFRFDTANISQFVAIFNLVSICQLNFLVQIIYYPIVELHDGIHLFPFLLLNTLQISISILYNFQSAQRLIQSSIRPCAKHLDKFTLATLEFVSVEAA